LGPAHLPGFVQEGAVVEGVWTLFEERGGADGAAKETHADELIVVDDVYDHPTRLRSFELMAEVARIQPQS
jgi:hypothetical protein